MRDYAQTIIATMAEQFMRHDYRAMWDLFESQVIPILQAPKDASGVRLKLAELERDEVRKENDRLRTNNRKMVRTIARQTALIAELERKINVLEEAAQDGEGSE